MDEVDAGHQKVEAERAERAYLLGGGPERADWDAPAFRAAVETVLEAGESVGVPVGTLGTTLEEIRTFGALGFDFLVAGVDFAHLVEGQQRARSAADDAL